MSGTTNVRRCMQLISTVVVTLQHAFVSPLLLAAGILECLKTQIHRSHRKRWSRHSPQQGMHWIWKKRYDSLDLEEKRKVDELCRRRHLYCIVTFYWVFNERHLAARSDTRAPPRQHLVEDAGRQMTLRGALIQMREF
ncbi:hypothetical protein VTO42DRAFT_3536 [Malbranchea cinnamomea]